MKIVWSLLTVATILNPFSAAHARDPGKPSGWATVVLPAAGTQASLNVTVSPNGVAATAKVQYGLTQSYGSEIDVPLPPTDGWKPQMASVVITGLTPRTIYYYRIVVTNSIGTYVFVPPGPSIYTTDGLPSAVTRDATTIGATSATLNGNVGGMGDPLTDVRFQWGVTPAYGSEIPLPPAVGKVSTVMSGLLPDTTYHFRLVASTSVGTRVGKDLTFTTLPIDAPQPPYVSLGGLSHSGGVGENFASVGGSICPNGLPTTAYLEYGPTFDYGSTIELVLSPNDGTTLQDVRVSLGPVLAGTTYHYRITATNSAGVTHTQDRTFTTLPPPAAPTVSDVVVTIGTRGVRLSATYNPRGAVTTAKIQYGLTSDYGTDISFANSYSFESVDLVKLLTDLIPGATYHCRVTATNSLGTASSSDVTFTVPGLPGVQTTYELRVDPAGCSAGVAVTADRKSAQASSPGDVIAVQLLAIVDNRNQTHEDDGFLMGVGSFLSGNGGLPGDFRGDIVGQPATQANNIPGLQNLPAQSGYLSDLDGDGDFDLGSLDTVAVASLKCFCAHGSVFAPLLAQAQAQAQQSF